MLNLNFVFISFVFVGLLLFLMLLNWFEVIENLSARLLRALALGHGLRSAGDRLQHRRTQQASLESGFVWLSWVCIVLRSTAYSFQKINKSTHNSWEHGRFFQKYFKKIPGF